MTWKHHMLLSQHILTMIFVISMSYTPSDFDFRTESKAYKLCEFDKTNIIVKIHFQKHVAPRRKICCCRSIFWRWYSSCISLILDQNWIYMLNQRLMEYQTLIRRISSSISIVKHHDVPRRKNTMRCCCSVFWRWYSSYLILIIYHTLI